MRLLSPAAPRDADLGRLTTEPFVVDHYDFREDGAFARGTLWALHNACTRAVKLLAPGPAFQATARLGKFFGLLGNWAEAP